MEEFAAGQAHLVQFFADRPPGNKRLWREKILSTVANVTRHDVRECLPLDTEGVYNTPS